jgi:solute:Na+ symporter, SSS family
MLLGFVILYLVISIGVGVYAATRVKNRRLFLGRTLPADDHRRRHGVRHLVRGRDGAGHPGYLPDENLGGTISDPFGASLALILFGLFIARPLYRMHLLTIGDFYRKRYNRPVEVVMSLAIALSYLGWVSAQIVALGLVFNVLSAGVITQEQGILIGASVVLIYTLYGGMWSVALTTFLQMTVIVAGLLWISVLVGDMPEVNGMPR